MENLKGKPHIEVYSINLDYLPYQIKVMEDMGYKTCGDIYFDEKQNLYCQVMVLND